MTGMDTSGFMADDMSSGVKPIPGSTGKKIVKKVKKMKKKKTHKMGP